MKFINTYYPIIIAFGCMLYSVWLGMYGKPDEALYTTHWPGTILLFAIAIRQVEKLRNDEHKHVDGGCANFCDLYVPNHLEYL